MKAKHIVIVIISLLLVILILQNLSSTVVNLFFWELKLPLTVILLTVLILGFFIGYLIHSLQTAAVKKRDKHNSS